jgi:hypothetical protein
METFDRGPMVAAEAATSTLRLKTFNARVQASDQNQQNSRKKREGK